MINKIYKNILKHILEQGFEQTNKRTGAKIKIAKNTLFFQINLENNILPIPGNRIYFPYIAAAETAWQILGTKNPEFILKYAPKLWEKFVEKGELKSAYGFRWRKEFKRDQLNLAIKALKKDSTNRQIYISNWNPSKDGLGEKNQPKNIPCPLGFTLNIIDGKLNMAVAIRSSDVYLGLPYDIFSYCLTLKAISQELKISLGSISFMLAHAHIYQNHWEFALNDINKKWKNQAHVKLPTNSIKNIEKNPCKYVLEMKKIKVFHSYNPQPKITI